jgi:cyclophilin family peptidyl-prolyl cis-trans isomerase
MAAGLAALVGAATANATEVALCTDSGRIVIELREDAAPLQVMNFLQYVEEGHYTGTVFHRVIADFMIQGGGFDRNLRLRAAPRTVENESRNGLSNERGTVAAARTSDPHSAAAQFYINLVDNPYLDASGSEWGYTVFGEVAEGMDVVDALAALPTGPAGPLASDVPMPLAPILSAAVLDRAALADVDGPDLQAALLARIAAAEETGNAAVALEWIGHYRASCSPAGPDLLVTEARNAIAAGAMLRARYALEDFFATAPKSHRNYAEAVELYEGVEPAGTAGRDFSRCVAPEAPAIPDGTSEDFEGMIRAQSAVQKFMRQSTTYLECLDTYIDNDSNTAESRSAAVRQYNSMVDLTQRVGDDFNRQVRAYRARQ